jgi:uncharacterized protein (TIGR00730 family)
MKGPRRVCIFCGSMRGTRPVYTAAAKQLGGALARQGVELVYGGGRVGLMGILADAALAAGGRVIGVIPEPLALKEIAHDGLSELIVVPGMHERKAQMATLCSAFLTMPGGIGTLEEFFEVLSWAVLGLHSKPVGVLNVDGYFNPLLGLLDHAVSEGFVKPEHRLALVISNDIDTLLARLLEYEPPAQSRRWIDLEQT